MLKGKLEGFPFSFTSAYLVNHMVTVARANVTSASWFSTSSVEMLWTMTGVFTLPS